MCLIQVLSITIYIGGSLVNGAALNGVANSNEIIGVPGKGKLLNVKSYPPIENYQSGLYEVYQEPYYLGINQQAAVAVLVSEEDEGVKGEVVFVQKHPPVGPVFIRGNITGKEQFVSFGFKIE
ncbi:hypothetical protein HUJ04_011036 [Dendroctonus ponderosae]|nr:hypothetical protein HUJ04_011036 [Dendroctonus ponderosae]KAH1028284.1 hypothetical protein HUJ05_001655 [Dendroctonus ponderosae]